MKSVAVSVPLLAPTPNFVGARADPDYMAPTPMQTSKVRSKFTLGDFTFWISPWLRPLD